MATIIIIITVAIALFFIWGEWATDKLEKQYQEQKDPIIKKYGSATLIIGDTPESYYDGETVFVFESAGILIISNTECKFSSILSFNIDGDRYYKVKTSNGNMVGRGIVGGLAFGGIGALAGAMTSSKKVNQTEREYVINITINDMSNPNIEYRTKDAQKANQLISVLKIIIDNDSI